MDKKQAQMKEQIREFMKKKDYYQILDVSKDCSQLDIKKAYKRLALRFHPDKNRVEGSKEVFKKVANAYSTLTNPEKRQRYDRYGPEEQQQAHAYAYHQSNQQFDNLDDLLSQLFGGGPTRFRQSRNHYQHFQYNMGGGRREARPEGQNKGFGLSFIFIILIVFYIVGPMFNSKPYHSLTESAQYKHKFITKILHVPYFARQEFQQSAKDQNFKKNVEQKVQAAYLTGLKKNCEQAIKHKKIYQYQAYSYNPGQQREQYLKKAGSIDQKACRQFQYFTKNFSQRVQQLFYYY